MIGCNRPLDGFGRVSFEEGGVKSLTLASGFFLAAATFAQAKPCWGVLCAAPTPSVGAGVPVALAAAAVLCGTMLVKLWRRS
jgi:hypothetical protein